MAVGPTAPSRADGLYVLRHRRPSQSRLFAAQVLHQNCHTCEACTVITKEQIAGAVIDGMQLFSG